MDRQSAAEVAEHLAKLGHTRIAMIVGPPTLSLLARAPRGLLAMRSPIAG